MADSPINSWSYSRIATFQKCPYRLFLQVVEKTPSEQSPQMLRGTEIHELAERFVRSEIDTNPEQLQRFEEDFKSLKELYSDGRVAVEEDWGFTENWEETGWFDNNCWARIKLDACVDLGERVRVIDYKTGKKYGNEATHLKQGQLYAGVASIKYPEAEFFDVEFWYLDKGGMLEKTFTREEAEFFLDKYTDMGFEITTATEFDPNPSNYNCKWCPYNQGVCKYSI